MNVQKIIRENKKTIRIIYFVLGTFIMFYAYFFTNRKFAIVTIIENKNNPLLYLCILFSFISVILIYYVIGGFKKSP